MVNVYRARLLALRAAKSPAHACCSDAACPDAADPAPAKARGPAARAEPTEASAW
jgi:hypothetical protein